MLKKVSKPRRISPMLSRSHKVNHVIRNLRSATNYSRYVKPPKRVNKTTKRKKSVKRKT